MCIRDRDMGDTHYLRNGDGMSAIDHIYTSDPRKIKETHTIATGISDHKAITLKVNRKKKAIAREKFYYKRKALKANVWNANLAKQNW